MRLKSDAFIPLMLTLALASLSTLAGYGRCLTGACAIIPMPKALAAAAVPQQGPGRGQVSAPRDPELEKQSVKSLEAAWFYFKKRLDKSDQQATLKRLEQIEGRLQEILDTYPAFSRLDEVYFLMGEVNQRRGDKEKAIEYYSKISKEFADSRFTKEAKKRLDELTGSRTNNKG